MSGQEDAKAQANGREIVRLRKLKGWTRKGLAQIAEVGYKTVTKAERSEWIRVNVLAEIAVKLGATPDQIMVQPGCLPEISSRTPVVSPSASSPVSPGAADRPPVPEKLREYILSFDTFIDDRRRDFTGRKFIFEALDAFLDDSHVSSGYFLIQGDPGIGKSALLAELIVRRQLSVYHFNIAPEGRNTPSQFIGNICARLVAYLGLPYMRFPEGFDKDGAFLSQLLHETSKRLSEQDPLVIAVDALDEVHVGNNSPTANPLFLPAALPRNVYFVLTTRIRHEIGLLANQVRLFMLDHASQENTEDVKAFIQIHLDNRGIRAWMKTRGLSESGFVDHLWEKSEGNFMYLRHVLPAIERGDFSKGGCAELPYGLREYYRRHWAQMRDHHEDVFDRLYRPVVCVLAAAYEAVPVEQVSEWTQIDASSVRRVTAEWLEFLHEEVAPDGVKRYRLYHTAFQEYLQEEVDPGLKTYHKMIAESIRRTLRAYKPPDCP